MSLPDESQGPELAALVCTELSGNLIPPVARCSVSSGAVVPMPTLPWELILILSTPLVTKPKLSREGK